MFRKTKIAAVTAAVLGLSSVAFAPAAQAVSLNENGGTGQVLIFPYYNVNNDFQTAFNIINTKNEYKAVKVRFRESRTSNDVLDFNLYMSPYDMFTMTLSKSASGGVTLSTSDTSCTFPEIKAPGDAVGTRDFKNVYTSVTDDIMREGYLEVIEMGVLDPDLKLNKKAITDSDDNPSDDGLSIAHSGIIHVNGKPKDCGLIRKAWDQGVFRQGGANSNIDAGGIKHQVNPLTAVSSMKDRQDVGSAANFYGNSTLAADNGKTPPTAGAGTDGVGLSAPTGGLAGSSVLIDIKNVSGFVVEPVSITHYSDRAQHYLPFDQNFYLLPSLASGSVSEGVTMGDNFTGSVQIDWPTVVRDFGLDDTNVAPNKHVPSGINPLPIAHVMAAKTVANQYFLGGTAKTDWVVTTPMKKHGIYNGFQYIPASANSYPDTKALPGRYMLVDAANASSGTAQDKIEAKGYWDYRHSTDVKGSFTYWDREEAEERPAATDIIFSPPIQVAAEDNDLVFPNEVNIMAFSEKGEAAGISVLGSMAVQQVKTIFSDGWGKITFDTAKYDLKLPRYTAAWATGVITSTPPNDPNNREIGAHARGVPLTGFMAGIVTINGRDAGETFPHIIERMRGQ